MCFVSSNFIFSLLFFYCRGLMKQLTAFMRVCSLNLKIKSSLVHSGFPSNYICSFYV